MVDHNTGCCGTRTVNSVGSRHLDKKPFWWGSHQISKFEVVALSALLHCTSCCGTLREVSRLSFDGQDDLRRGTGAGQCGGEQRGKQMGRVLPTSSRLIFGGLRTGWTRSVRLTHHICRRLFNHYHYSSHGFCSSVNDY